MQLKWYSFEDFTNEELYDILRLRQEVFIVEQECAYLDCDGLDKVCQHLVGRQTIDGKYCAVAYLRLLPPQPDTNCVGIGRVLIHPRARMAGLGRKLMNEGLSRLRILYPGTAVRVSAQEYLADFYNSLGFQQSSQMYLEDGIPHLEMILEKNSI